MVEAKAEQKKAAPVKKPAVTKETAKGGKKTLVVVQHGSKTCVSPSMCATLAGLGLGKTNSTRELEDTASVRGMIRKVRHLVHVQGEE